MFAAGLLFCAFFFSLTLGWPTANDTLHVHEKRSDIPSPQAFQYIGEADPTLYDVSTPGSKNHRRHLTKAQVRAQLKSTVMTYKNNVTIDQVSSNESRMNICVPVAQANSLLDAQFNEYSHEDTGLMALRTMSYSVPASVKGHLDFIYPATSFTPPRATPAELHILPSHQTTGRMPRRGRAKDQATHSANPKAASSTSSKATETKTPDDSCKTKITPACLQAIYGIPSDAALNRLSNIFVASFVGESADPADLKKFLGEFRPDMDDKTTFRVKDLDGGSNNRVQATVEASLDVQYAIGIATGVDTTFVSVGSNNSDGIAGFPDVINDLISQEEVPFVLITSFGFDEETLPVGLANNLCNAYAQLGARGTMILFGSGNGGVAGIQTKNCTTFVPPLPSSCPFVTSVGGTNSFGPEVGVSLSAGGFSNMFARPQYQEDAVYAYLGRLGDTNKGLYNVSGRAFPDIAAQVKSFQVVRGGQTISVSGTSAASPTVAGVVALLNDAIFKSGGKPLGFLNPLLYSDAKDALNDITQGNNPGCGTDGFPTSEGWDPVTGLGTPNFVKFLDAIQKSA
ncbi:hypothetical protein V8D89_002993 [Ganoderma adspersum]